MKSLSLNSRKIETLTYALLWVFVFSVPFFVQRNEFHIINWQRLTNEWIHLAGYLLVFLLNVYLLVPKLLLRKKYLYYFTVVVLTIGIVTSADLALHPGDKPERIPQSGFQSGEFRPEIHVREPKPLLMGIIDSFIICFLIVGAGTTSKLMSKWLSEEKLRKDIEKEQLKTNLALLRHQVSPHFFMNTLNNIHTLIEINSEKAQEAIVMLSTLMRYLLYDSARNTIELRKEIEFINSFITLMQLRLSDETEVQVVVPEQIPDTQIPPMLFISLLENAFKHGVSYPLKSYIYFEIQINNNSLHCIIRNSKHKTVINQYDEYSGIGLENIKKSLKLLYDEDYLLTIKDKENEFEVNLSIPL